MPELTFYLFAPCPQPLEHMGGKPQRARPIGEGLPSLKGRAQ
jgi:hypothetical protein